MMRSPLASPLATVAAVGLLLSIAARAPAQETGSTAPRLDPSRHWPYESLFHLEVPSGKRLVDALASTLPGRIACDPEVRAALGSTPASVWAAARQGLAPFIAITGRDPLELLALLEGEVVLSVTGLDPYSYVSVVLAIEMGRHRDALRDVVARVARAAAPPGEPPATAELAGRPATVIRTPGPPVYALEVGTHLVIGLSRDVLEGIVRSWEGKADAAGLRLAANEGFQKAFGRVVLDEPRLRLAVHVEALRSLAMGALLGSPDGQQVIQLLGITGLASLGRLTYALGARDGDIEGKLFMSTASGDRGLLGAVIDGFAPLSRESRAAALARVPAVATSAGAMRVDPGKILRAVRDIAASRLPAELWGPAAEAIRGAESRLGLSLEKDVFPLGPIELFCISATPPAGSLFDDCLLLARTESLKPWLEIALRMGRLAGKEPLVLREGERDIRYLRAAGIGSRLLGREPPAASALPDRFEDLLPLLLDPALSIATARIDGGDENGWTIVAAAPQPIRRFLRYHLAGPRLEPDAALARRFLESPGAGVTAAFAPSRGLLMLYNAALVFAPARVAIPVGPVTLELDGMALPPAEKFLPALGPGFLSLDLGPEGIGIHGHRVLSSSAHGCLIIGGAAAAAAGFQWAGARAGF